MTNCPMKHLMGGADVGGCCSTETVNMGDGWAHKCREGR